MEISLENLYLDIGASSGENHLREMVIYRA